MAEVPPRKMAAGPPLPPFSAATAVFRRYQKTIFIAFLAELGNLKSFGTMLFFSKIFLLTSNPAGGLSHFFKVYLKISGTPVL